MGIKKIWDDYPLVYKNITDEQLSQLLSIEEVLDIYDNFPERWNYAEDLPGEVWVPIQELENKFSISCYGRLKENRMTYTIVNYKGYIKRVFKEDKIINGYVINKRNYPEHYFRNYHIHYTIHRLVSMYFIEKSDISFNYIDHKNIITTCAHILNLWWCNSKLNSLNPLTVRKVSSISSLSQNKNNIIEIDENAKETDNIEDYLNKELLFSPRMMTPVNFKGEIWKYLFGYDIYVSNYGRFKKIENNNSKIIKQRLSSCGYLTVCFDNGCYTSHYVVLYAFGKIDNMKSIDPSMQIDHISTLPYDNRLENLRYVSQKDNMKNSLTRQHMSEKYDKESRSTKILVYCSSDKKFFKEFPSITDAAKYFGTSSGLVKRALDLKCQMHKKWYIVEKPEDGIIPEFIEIQEKQLNNNKPFLNTKKLKVNQYDYNGKYLNTYDTIKELNILFNHSNNNTMISFHINSFDRETVFGYYFRYTEVENTADLWDSGLFNNSENSKCIQEISKKCPNIIKITNKVINVYDVLDGVIIKRYYSGSLCARELNVDRGSLRHGSVLLNKYYILITENNDDFQIMVDVPKIATAKPISQYETDGTYIRSYNNIYEIIESNSNFEKNNIYRCCNRDKNNLTAYGYVWRWSTGSEDNIESIDYIKERNSRAFNNDILVYNYYSNEFIGSYSIYEASDETGIGIPAIINCCEGIYESFVNMETLENYMFCYKFNRNEFEEILKTTNEEKVLYVVYDFKTGSKLKVFYSKVELINYYGIEFDKQKIYNGKYIVKKYNAGMTISDTVNVEEYKKVSHNQYSFIENKILKFDMDGNFIEQFDRLSDITNDRTKQNKIRSCANMTLKTAYGFQWRWEKECSSKENIGKPDFVHSYAKYGKIFKMDKTGNIIEVFDNLDSVPIKDKKQKEVIHSCALGKKTSAYGFLWKYEKSLEELEEIKYSSRKVNAYKEDGTFIKSFNNVTTAAKYFNIREYKVSACCLGYQKNIIIDKDTNYKITFKYSDDK